MDSSATARPVRVFVSYRHADTRVLDELAEAVRKRRAGQPNAR